MRMVETWALVAVPWGTRVSSVTPVMIPGAAGPLHGRDGVLADLVKVRVREDVGVLAHAHIDVHVLGERYRIVAICSRVISLSGKKVPSP